ncbi:MAG: VOC family protein [Vicinamibacterales bacterium]
MTTFAPHLYVRTVAPAIEFYRMAFEAIELRRWSNPDGSVHVAELAIDGAMFHVHEERAAAGQRSPESIDATTSQIGLFVDDPDRVLELAAGAGGRVVNPMRDFDYGYRQGVIADPFGHQWLLQKRIPAQQ